MGRWKPEDKLCKDYLSERGDGKVIRINTHEVYRKAELALFLHDSS